jgi:hypothetical protein
LPAGFDKKLIELEFQIEQDHKEETIIKLLECYNVAITFYDETREKQMADIFR